MPRHSGACNSCLDVRTEPIDRRLDAARAVRDAQRLEGGLDDAERAQHHGGVDVTHMGDAERLAVKLADALAEDDAAAQLQ